jgi:hypothetical protein
LSQILYNFNYEKCEEKNSSTLLISLFWWLIESTTGDSIQLNYVLFFKIVKRRWLSLIYGAFSLQSVNF